jgi:hypothetical protein
MEIGYGRELFISGTTLEERKKIRSDMENLYNRHIEPLLIKLNYEVK